jgi:hypothetical protein
MRPAIDSPASCEIRSMGPFLRGNNMSAAGIHRELYVVQDQNVTSVEC